jgi:ankyrin repeat protein
LNPLCRDFKGNTPLHYAACDGNHLDVVAFFIKELGIDCNIGGHHSKTPLHFA